MRRSLYRNPGARAAEQRGIIAQAMHRAVAAAETHRDRARAGIVRLEAQIAEREGLGLSTDSAMAHLSRLRFALTEAEASLAAARRTLGRDRAA